MLLLGIHGQIDKFSNDESNSYSTPRTEKLNSSRDAKFVNRSPQNNDFLKKLNVYSAIMQIEKIIREKNFDIT